MRSPAVGPRRGWNRRKWRAPRDAEFGAKDERGAQPTRGTGTATGDCAGVEGAWEGRSGAFQGARAERRLLQADNGRGAEARGGGKAPGPRMRGCGEPGAASAREPGPARRRARGRALPSGSLSGAPGANARRAFPGKWRPLRGSLGRPRVPALRGKKKIIIIMKGDLKVKWLQRRKGLRRAPVALRIVRGAAGEDLPCLLGLPARSPGVP